MTKLMRYGYDWLVFNVSAGVCVLGTFEQAMDALERCGVDAGQVDIALDDFYNKGHNHADFGVNGFLTFTNREAYLAQHDKKVA